MPNHVTHRAVITGPEADIVAFINRAIKTERNEHTGEDFPHLDFNAFIPMPKCLEGITAGTTTELAIYALTGRESPEEEKLHKQMGIRENFFERYGLLIDTGVKTQAQLLKFMKEKHPESLEQGKRAIQAIEETGCANWYEWCNKNWGTKWNSYSFRELKREDGRYEFKFETAWAPPTPVIDKIAEEFPTLKMEIRYFDEGSNFAGKFVIKDGDCMDVDCKPTKRFARTVYGEDYVEDDEN